MSVGQESYGEIGACDWEEMLSGRNHSRELCAGVQASFFYHERGDGLYGGVG